MTRTRLILICSFIICFAAGVAAGFLGGVLVRPAPRHHESRMTRGLNLTPQQTEQMDKIWPWPPPRRDQDPRMAALDKDREQAVTALLGEDLKAKYDDLISQYSAKRRACASRRMPNESSKPGRSWAPISSPSSRSGSKKFARPSNAAAVAAVPAAATLVPAKAAGPAARRLLLRHHN